MTQTITDHSRSRKFKRSDRPDTEWSAPGSTRGIADRYTQRNLCGLFITAGHNARKGPDYTAFVIPESKTPWKVYALGMTPTDAHPHWSLVLVASGTAKSVALAKRAAERAALACKLVKP